MPLDPSIILAGRPAQIPSPLETMGQIAQLQGMREQTEARRLAADEARQKAADDAAIRRVLTETGGDIAKALPQLRTIAPKAALEFETEIAKQQKEAFDALTKKTALTSQRLDLGVKLLGGVTDQASYDLVRPMIGTMSPEIAQAMGDAYDPARVAQFVQLGVTEKERYDRRQDALKLFTEGKANEALGTYLSTAQTADEWHGITAAAKAQGVPDAVIAPYGEFSPENVARAAQLAITPSKRAELAGQAEARAQTAAHQGVLEAQGAERVVIARQRAAQGPAGPAGGAGAGRALPATQAGKIADYDSSRDDLNVLAAAIAPVDPKTGELKSGVTGVSAQAGALLPNWVTEVTGWGTDAKQKQALIDRVKQVIGKTLEEGVLRKEDEYKYAKILPTIGDSTPIVVAKLQGLDQAILQRRQRDLEAYEDAGYDVSRFAARPVAPALTIGDRKNTDANKTAPPPGQRFQILKVE